MCTSFPLCRATFFWCHNAPTLRSRAFLLAGKYLRQQAGIVQRCSEDRASSSTVERFALFVDGDRIGPSHWAPLLDKVRSLGVLVDARVYAPSGFSTKARWRTKKQSLGIKLVEVPRRLGGVKNANDIAISVDAARCTSTGEVSAVALAVTDVDFVYLAERLLEWGIQVVALMPEGRDERLHRAFQEAGAEVVQYVAEESKRGKPRFLAILQSSGESSFVPDSSDDHSIGFVEDQTRIVNTLQQLGYLDSVTDPIVPAIAKFYHVNDIGPLTVWPEMYPRAEVFALLSRNPGKVWARCTGQYAFVSPRATTTLTKANQDAYGSAQCSSVVRGGGPFILRDSETLVCEFLQRLGYLDDGFNPYVEEAISVFCTMGMNRSNLEQLGVDICSPALLLARSLRNVLVSSKSYGVWRTAPSDALVRGKLASHGLIPDQDADKEEVFVGLQRFVQKMKLKQWRTYNGLVLEVLQHRAKSNPTHRR